MKMCRAFAKNGHNVTLLARRGEIKDIKNEYDYYGVNNCFQIKKLSFSVGILEKVLYLIRVWWHVFKYKGRYDFIYGRFLYGIWLASKTRTPFSYESHSPPCGMLERAVEKSTLKSPSMMSIIVISNSLKEIYKKLYSWMDSKKILVAHDGADVLKEREVFRENTGPAVLGGKGKIKIGYVGSLYQGRGIELIIQLARRLPDMDFHIMGGSDLEISKYKKYTANGNIFFYKFVPHAKIGNYLREFDILLAPYQKKVGIAKRGKDTVKWMSPLKIFEYMSYGKAIVCSDLPVLKEILENKKTALLCHPENVEEWVNAINQLHSPDLRNLLGKNAKYELENKYAWDIRAKNVLEDINI